MSTTIGSVYDINDFAYNDNEPGTIEKLQELNDFYRRHPWPKEHSVTTHSLCCSDSRNLSRLENESVHLIVTSPPYWTLKDYPPNERQLGAVEDYEKFLDELDKVWSECVRVLAPGAGFVVSSGMSAFQGSERADTTLCRFTPTSLFEFANSDWIL